MTDDEAFWLDVVTRLNPAHAPPGLFQQATQTAVDWFGSTDLSALEDDLPQTGFAGPPPRIEPAQRKLLTRLMAASSAIDFLERLSIGLPKQTSHRLSMVFLRIGIAGLAGQRITITDILREDGGGHAPAPGWPDGKRKPTFTPQTIRNGYIALETAGLLKTEPGHDAEARNRYLVLTDKGKALFEAAISRLR